MKPVTIGKAAAERPTRRSMAKLFRVLVLGGAVLAAASGSVLRGSSGSPQGDQDDGGTQGW